MFNNFLKKNKVEIYSEKDQLLIENHITNNIGNFESVLHEIASDDIHVDICVIEPTIETDFYSLVTMGAGAHKMNVPKELKNDNLSRAEFIVTLPPDWNIQSSDEKWYWPIRWLKTLARLPINNDTWLGSGHTVQNPDGKPFAENTALNSVMVSKPYSFFPKTFRCRLSNGEEVKFYQMIPLYESEMKYKLENSAEELIKLFPEEYDWIVDVNRSLLV
jgi:hypothetical protein